MDIITLLSFWGLVWQILRAEGMEVEEGIYFQYDKQYAKLGKFYRFAYSVRSVYKPLINCKVIDRIYEPNKFNIPSMPESRDVGILEPGCVVESHAYAPEGARCAVVVQYSTTSKIRKRIITRAVKYEIKPIPLDSSIYVQRYWWRWHWFAPLCRLLNERMGREFPLGRWVRMKSSCKSVMPDSAYSNVI